MLTIAACADSSSPSQQGRAGAGSEGALQSADRPDASTLPAPEVEKGVVPDLVGTSLKEARKAIDEAGFTEGEIEGGIGAGSIIPDTLVICAQDPEPGSTPKKGTEINLEGRLECPA